jgi:U3 small nucleolar RNA-associated protein 14
LPPALLSVPSLTEMADEKKRKTRNNNDRQVMKKRKPSTSKTLNHSNKKKKNRDVRERRKRTGPHLPNYLRKEIELTNKAKPRNSDDDEEEEIDSDEANDVYEYEEAIPEEESGKNRRYDPVENFEYDQFRACCGFYLGDVESD